MNKIILYAFGLGILTMIVVVKLNPNPNRTEHQSFGIIHTNMHVESPTVSPSKTELRITKTGEWKAAFPGKPNLSGSHVTQRLPNNWIKTGIDEDKQYEQVIEALKE